jgi:transposase
MWLVAKYADHLPLYRQAQIYGRQGVNLDRSTLADWVINQLRAVLLERGIVVAKGRRQLEVRLA